MKPFLVKWFEEEAKTHGTHPATVEFRGSLSKSVLARREPIPEGEV